MLLKNNAPCRSPFAAHGSYLPPARPPTARHCARHLMRNIPFKSRRSSKHKKYNTISFFNNIKREKYASILFPQIQVNRNESAGLCQP